MVNLKNIAVSAGPAILTCFMRAGTRFPAAEAAERMENGICSRNLREQNQALGQERRLKKRGNRSKRFLESRKICGMKILRSYWGFREGKSWKRGKNWSWRENRRKGT